jgi:uncharacterized protein (TIGR03083 family)
VLADTIIHGQDIRRPLGITRDFGEDTLRRVADLLIDSNFNCQSKKRAAGLRLEATDIAWSSGSGAVLRGPLEALIMAMAGRKAALADLRGDGVATLAGRS